MSTHNLPGMHPGRNAMGRIAQAARTRAAAVRQGLEALDGEEENVRIGAAALLQSIDDDRAPLAEEGEQLLAILNAGRQQQTQAPQTETPAEQIPVIVQQTPAPQIEATEPEPASVAPATTPEPVTTTPVPTSTQPLPAQPAQDRRSIRRGDLLQWSLTTRVLALIGGIIGVTIGNGTRGWVGDLADLHSGFAPWALKALWIVAVSAVGYYTFGYFYEAVRNRLELNPDNPEEAT